MARNSRQQFLATMSSADATFKALFGVVARDGARILQSNADSTGKIPPARGRAVREAVGREITKLFLGSTGRGDVAPYTVDRGRVIPLSPYMAALWAAIQQVTQIAVEQQANIMRRQLATAPDVLRAFESAKRSPFAEAKRVKEQTDWRKRPFLDYDPGHRFVSPQGYTLSNRIWRASVDTRRKVDAILAEGIASGRSAFDMARELEAFLVPGRVLRRTTTPYGRDASADAMRLARTEITAAHSRAGVLAANLNPFITGANIRRSAAHRPCNSGVCDALEAGSPYPLDKLPDIPGDSHPHCMCRYEWVVSGDLNMLIDELRGALPSIPMAGAAQPDLTVLDVIGPLMVEQFVGLLLNDPVDEYAMDYMEWPTHST